MKTSELTGAALDWAVAKCEGNCEGDFSWYYDRRDTFNYSTDWAQGGPIIEREGIDVHRVNPGLWSAKWWANNSGMAKNPAQRFKHNITTDGPTPLIAAMRCYVASKLGDEVNLPGELA
jgi:hypothetical protein